MNNKRAQLGALLSAAVIAGAGLMAITPASATNEMVTICHAAGLEGTTQYVTLTIAWPAVYGEAGHFYENGTPRAGHEQDYLGACTTPTTPTTPTTQGDDPDPTTTTTAPPDDPTTSTTAPPSDPPADPPTDPPVAPPVDPPAAIPSSGADPVVSPPEFTG